MDAANKIPSPSLRSEGVTFFICLPERSESSRESKSLAPILPKGPHTCGWGMKPGGGFARCRRENSFRSRGPRFACMGFSDCVAARFARDNSAQNDGSQAKLNLLRELEGQHTSWVGCQ